MKIILTLLFFNSLIVSSSAQELQENQFKPTQTVPEFPGGVAKYYKFLNTKLKYPKAARIAKAEGQVFVEFSIAPSGKVIPESVRILKGVHDALDNEAIRVVKLSPDWIPSHHLDTNNPVESKVVVPITFSLSRKNHQKR